MIRLRTREYGSDEWTIMQFDGPQEAACADCVAEDLEEHEFHVQVAIGDGPWENYEGPLVEESGL